MKNLNFMLTFSITCPRCGAKFTTRRYAATTEFHIIESVNHHADGIMNEVVDSVLSHVRKCRDKGARP